MWNKFKNNKDGFTLTEVLIGIMILTVAIVAATNLLVGLVNSNQNNLTTMQAYYLAQEGIEGVRNIRDTNWLHNTNWLGEGAEELWGDSLEVGGEYSINLRDDAFTQAATRGLVGKKIFLKAASPWNISSSGGSEVEGFNKFKRTIFIKSYNEENHVLVEAKVEWDLGAKHREVVLSGVLSNWKGGAL